MASQEYDGPGTIDRSGHGRLLLKNGPDALQQLHRFFEAFTNAVALPSEAAQPVDLALTEWVTNILSYGFQANQPGTIAISLHWHARELRIEIEDTAAPFNPLEYPAVDVSRPLHEKPVGGLGIHLVRSVMDELQYRRLPGGNGLLMIKRLGQKRTPP